MVHLMESLVEERPVEHAMVVICTSIFKQEQKYDRQKQIEPTSFQWVVVEGSKATIGNVTRNDPKYSSATHHVDGTQGDLMNLFFS